MLREGRSGVVLGIKSGATAMLAKPTFLSAIVAVACAASGIASAQTFPNRPIRIVVGFAPAGPADVMARLIGQRLTSILGQSIVIDNRPGAAPVAALGTTSNLLIVNPAMPVKSVQELIALARANPGKLNYASAGIGTPPHLIGEMFKQRLNLDVVHVPYKGGGPSVAATVAGETQFSFENPASSLPLVEAGQVRALASTSDRRSSQMPDVPTMIEAGVADFTSVSFTGVVAPTGTPDAIVHRLNADINASLQSPEVASALVRLGVDAKISSPQEFAAFLARERDKWAAVIKAAGVRAQ